MKGYIYIITQDDGIPVHLKRFYKVGISEDPNGRRKEQSTRVNGTQPAKMTGGKRIAYSTPHPSVRTLDSNSNPCRIIEFQRMQVITTKNRK